MSLIKKITLGSGASAVEYDIGALAENVPYDDENSIKTEMNSHIREAGASEEGSHGIRYLKDDENLQVWDNEREIWIDVTKGDVEDLYIGDIIGAAFVSEGTTVHIMWTDPEDVVTGGKVVAEWAGTKVVRKRGSAPANVEDGTVIVDSKVRNQYSSNGFVDSGLEREVVYYYRFFPYIIRGLETKYTPGYSKMIKASRGIVSKMPSPVSALIYNGETQSPQWNDYDINKLSMSGKDSARPIGTYSVSFTPREGYAWSDGGVESRSVNWYIIAEGIAIPTVTNTSLIYNGTVQGPTISNYNSDIINVEGKTATNAGQYIITFSFVDPSAYAWEGVGNSNPKTVEWSINPQTVGIPTLSGDYYYTGRSQSVTISAYDGDIVIPEGSMSGISAGSYIITFRLANIDNYKWIDNTVDLKSMSWEIKKAVCAVTLTYNGEPVTSESNIPLNVENPTSISIVKPNESGTISATSSAPTIAAVSVNNNNELIITTSGTVNGTANITVNVAESSNYNSYSIIFKATTLNAELVSWSTGTDSQIQNMVAKYYNGEFTLDQIKLVWSLGDTRTVHLSAMSATGVSESHRAQTVEMRIIDFDHDYLVTPLNGKTKALITVDMKDCLMDAECAAGTKKGWFNTENGYMNDTKTNSTGWHGSKRRIWCNNVCYNAFPTNFKNMIKQVKKSTASTGGTLTPAWWASHDYCFILSEWEVYGVAKFTYETGEITSHVDKTGASIENSINMEAGGTQYEHLKTISNRLRLPMWDGDMQYAMPWLRSPCAVISKPLYGEPTLDTEMFCTEDFYGRESGHSNAVSIIDDDPDYEPFYVINISIACCI